MDKDFFKFKKNIQNDIRNRFKKSLYSKSLILLYYDFYRISPYFYLLKHKKHV